MPANGSRLRLAGSLLWLAAALSACAKNTVPPEPPQAVRRGDEAFRYQQYATAIDAYHSYVHQTEQGPYTARALYKTALAQFRLRQYHATLATLDDLTQRYPNGHWVQVEALRGDTERAQGNTMVALQHWEKAWELANDKDRQKLRPRIVAAAQDLSDVDLAHARRVATDESFAAMLDRQIAARQPPDLAEPIPNAPDDSTLDNPEGELAKPPPVIEEPTEPVVQPRGVPPPRNKPAPAPVTAEPLSSPDDTAWAPPPPPPPPPAAQPQPAPAQAPPPPSGPIEKDVARGTAQIGCLLPLSGSERDVGERALRAVRLVFGTDNKRLVVADTESDATVAVRQFDRLAHDPRVVAVIGPLRSDEATVVAGRAGELHVPVLLLSRRDGLNGAFALQVGVTPAEEVNGLLNYTMGKIRLRRFALFYPKGAADVAGVFRSEVERRGGTIVGAVVYPPGTRSLMSEAPIVRKWRDRDNLQAVFLPDDAAAAAEFSNFLQREMPDVTLLGVQGWEALAQHESRLNGILFTDGFYAASDRPATRAFVNRFQQAYGSTPGLVEADAYDAAVLAERALEKGVSSPSGVTFRGLGPVKGAAGDLTVTEQGVSRNLFLLQVSGGRVEEIGESPSSTAQEAGGAERTPAAHALTTRPEPGIARPLPEAGTLRDEPLEPPPSAPPPRTETHTTPLPPVTAQAAIAGAPTNAKVACLLPLTGPDQAYGKRALAGLRLAFDDAPAELIVRDTGGDPTTAADWLARLQDNPEVVAVVGPLRSTEAEIVVPMAEQQHLPLLLLSQREGLSGRYVLQLAMTRTQQIRLLVHYSVAELKLRRFGIVYPNDGYGSAFAETFRKEAASQGASVVGTHPYPPGSTSFASAVVDVRGWQRAGLDAVFIPDAAPTATALAADVRSEVPGVVLLGTESWNDAKSLADAGSAIDGAIFADAFFADSHRPSTREFVERFQQRFGEAPTVFEAQAFDAGMALRQVIAHGTPSRERIVAELAALGTFQGAGELRAAPSGLERSVSLLRFHDGKVEEVSSSTRES